MTGVRRRPAQRLRIWRGMDVYDAEQTAYIGAVVGLITAPQRMVPAAEGGEPAGGAATGAGTRVVTEQAQTAPVVRSGEPVLGEELGPFPTVEIGNSGPVRQSAGHRYATAPGDEPADVRGIVVRPGRLNPFARPLYIPVRAVRSISMNRLILDVRREEIPAAWRSRAAIESDGEGGAV